MPAGQIQGRPFQALAWEPSEQHPLAPAVLLADFTKLILPSLQTCNALSLTGTCNIKLHHQEAGQAFPLVCRPDRQHSSTPTGSSGSNTALGPRMLLRTTASTAAAAAASDCRWSSAGGDSVLQYPQLDGSISKLAQRPLGLGVHGRWLRLRQAKPVTPTLYGGALCLMFFARTRLKMDSRDAICFFGPETWSPAVYLRFRIPNTQRDKIFTSSPPPPTLQSYRTRLQHTKHPQKSQAISSK